MRNMFEACLTPNMHNKVYLTAPLSCPRISQREGGPPTTTPTAAPATTVPAGVTTRSGGRKRKDSKHQDEPKKSVN